MNDTTEEKVGYTTKLQHFITEHCAVKASDSIHHFAYKDYDLRYAASKKLYFKFIDNPTGLFAYQKAIQSRFQQLIRITIQTIRTSGKNFITQTRKHTIQPKRTLTSLAFVTSLKHQKYLSDIGFSADHIITLSDLQKIAKKSKISLNKSSPFIIANHLDIVTTLQAIENIIITQKPKNIFLVEGNTMIDSLVSVCASKHDAKTTCFQYGWSFVPHLGFQNMGPDYFLSWGPAFSNALRPFNPKTTFIDFGHPLLHGEIKSTNKLVISAIYQAPARWMGKDTFDAFSEACIKLGELGFKMLIREHPAWPLPEQVIKRFERIDSATIVNTQETSLNKQLNDSTVVLTVFSSVGFESALTNCIPVFYQPKFLQAMFPDMSELGIDVVFTSWIDLLHQMKRLQDPELIEHYQDLIEKNKWKLFSKNEGNMANLE